MSTRNKINYKTPFSHYTIKQLMEHWQCSDGFIRKLLGRGKLQYIKINSAVRISTEEVEKFERDRTVSRATL